MSSGFLSLQVQMFDPWWMGVGRGEVVFHDKKGVLEFKWPKDENTGEVLDPFALLVGVN